MSRYEALFHGCTTNKGEIIAFCTEPKSQGMLDVRPNYLVLRVGTHKGINMEVAFKAASDLNYQMFCLRGANTGRALRGSMQLSPTYSRAVILMVSGFMV